MSTPPDRHDSAIVGGTTSSSGRVLYVDDDSQFATLAGEYIEREERIATVVTETNPREALRRVAAESFDCIVSDYRMPEMDGLTFLEAVREISTELPFILVTGRGSEEIASEAISAGVTDYFEKPHGVDQFEIVANRISNAVEQYRTRREIERTRRQYRRLIEESMDVVIVVGEDGRFEYVSTAAKRRLGYSASELRGDVAFGYIHPDDEAAVRERFTTLLEQPTRRVSVEFRFEQRDDSWRWLEARGRNVLDDPDIDGIVVYARDVTERKKREQRFRALFEKAFDAMVIANDDGRCVDANPAASELFELTHDELIGRSISEFADDDVDFEARWQELIASGSERRTVPIVSAEGTARIVEVAATSNVVSGQHFAILRDVTDREQHEQAVTALHDSSRNLLSSGSKSAVAGTIVEAVHDLLAIPAVGVYLFDHADGVLRPHTVSDEFSVEEPLEPLAPQQDSVVGSTFLSGNPHVASGQCETETSLRSELPIREQLFLPLGTHGVCVIGDAESEITTDELDLAEILTAAAETALDRIDTEEKLRERKTELEAQNQRLAQLNRINATVRELNKTIAQAESRSEIETAICTQLSAIDDIPFVWIGEYDSQRGRLVPREWSGTDGSNQYLDGISLSVDESTEPAARAALAEGPIYVENIADGLHEEGWRKTALANGFRSAISISLTYKQISYGIVTVYTERANPFQELPRQVLMDIGNTLASAINAVEHQNALLSGTVTELELGLTDETLPIYAVASEADCTLTLEGATPQSDGTVLKYVSVEGVEPNVVTEIAAELTAVSETEVVTDDGESGVITVRTSGWSLTGFFADRGIRVPTLVADPESATVTLLVPDTVDDTWVFEQLEERYSGLELRSKQRRSYPPSEPGQGSFDRFRSTLTSRQQEVLQTAYHSGFFQSPRECTGENLAEHLDISPQTFYRHVRNSERALFETIFGEGE